MNLMDEYNHGVIVSVGETGQFKVTVNNFVEARLYLAKMNDVVEEYGRDYVYTKFIKNSVVHGGLSCWYLDNNRQCSCLIGHVLHRMGWTLDEIDDVEGSPAASLYCHKNKISRLTSNLLDCAQIAQDAGDAWGVAYDGAINLYADYVKQYNTITGMQLR